MDKYRIDSHKLIYHPERVAEWVKEGDCFPIYVEISPTGKCNHRCSFCALDYIGYSNPELEAVRGRVLIKELAQVGVKAIMFAGEGEPLLCKGIAGFIGEAALKGIDTSITTNGVYLDRIFSKLDFLSWVRISLDAGTKQTHSRIHGCKEEDFEKIMQNISNACVLTRNKKTTIGVQVLLLEENINEVLHLGRVLKELGVNYLSIKPYSQHPDSNSKVHPVTEKEALEYLEGDLFELSTDGFQASIRSNAFTRAGTERTYEDCLGLPFFCYISSLGEVYPCSTYLGNPDFVYGSINKTTFEKVWKSQQREDVLNKIHGMDISTCRENCRLDPINQYLWKLKHPPAHVNFI